MQWIVQCEVIYSDVVIYTLNTQDDYLAAFADWCVWL